MFVKLLTWKVQIRIEKIYSKHQNIHQLFTAIEGKTQEKYTKHKYLWERNGKEEKLIKKIEPSSI